MYNVRTVNFGSVKFPLNLYGDDKNYKGFPELGETINKDGILMGLRPHAEELDACLTSNEDLRNYDTGFDDIQFVYGPGGEITLNGEKHKTGVVTDIKCYYNPAAKAPNNIYPKTLEKVEKYTEALKQFYSEIYHAYENGVKRNANLNRRPDNTIPMSPRFTKLIETAMVMKHKGGDGKEKNVRLTYKDIELDAYTMEFTVQYKMPLRLGSKISCLHGGKGVVVDILPDHLMPKDSDGVPVDIVMDPLSIVSRMNVGRLYEIYIAGAARSARDLVRKELEKGNKNKAWELVLEFLELIGTEQLDYYRSADDNGIEEILEEIRRSELHVFYRVSSPKPIILIVSDIEKSKFKPKKEPITINVNGKEKKTKNPCLIGVIYNILLTKTPDESLSVTSDPYLNHFKMPTAPTAPKKYSLPWANKATKIIGETETRLFLSYGGAMLLAELRDRAINPSTVENIHKNLLTIDTPGFTENIVTREEAKFGMDVALTLFKNVLSAVGYELKYVPDSYYQFDETCDPSIGLKTNVNKKPSKKKK